MFVAIHNKVYDGVVFPLYPLFAVLVAFIYIFYKLHVTLFNMLFPLLILFKFDLKKGPF